MEIFDYTTAGGKNLIMEYILSQPVKDKTVLLAARKLIRTRGVKAFSMLNTRQLRGKLYEIKIEQNRIMYIIADADAVYFLHICKKQKGKAEMQELNKAISRAKAAGLM
ncbi:MAG: type II toxin-antitoxin system RelE/ParE family toxin [Lachnospiraceae bacterium]|nr:type II toxin-antitoxin system RelE/ParE family toxin [Lachnospiraceae bacterium]